MAWGRRGVGRSGAWHREGVGRSGAWHREGGRRREVGRGAPRAQRWPLPRHPLPCAARESERVRGGREGGSEGVSE
eukprot:651285-Rhodomonas_salina.1